MDSRIARHGLFVADLCPSDADGRALHSRRLAAGMVADDASACSDFCNGSDAFESVRSIAEQIQRIADYVATGEEVRA